MHFSGLIASATTYGKLLSKRYDKTYHFFVNVIHFFFYRSRNVFLRVTDGRKYCYYSSYAWSCTIIMGVIAVAAHFALEIPKSKTSTSLLHNQEVIGKKKLSFNKHVIN